MQAQIRKVRHDPLFYGCIALGFVLLLILFYGQFHRAFHFPTPKKTVYEDTLNDRGQRIQRDATLEGNVSFSDEGMVLQPGENLTVRYDFTKEPLEKVVLSLWFFKTPYVSNRLQLIREGGQPLVVANQHFQGSPPLNLTEPLAGFRRFSLILSAQVSEQAPQRAYLIYDQIKLERSTDVSLPPLPSLLMLYVAFLLTLTLSRATAVLKPFYPLIGFGVFGILVIKFKLVGDLYVTNHLIVWLLLALLWFSIVKKWTPQLLPAALNLTFLFLLIVAFDLRWQGLENAKTNPLPSDAITYRSIAHYKGGGLFNTNFREPAFIWAVRLFFWLFGSSEINLRLVSLYASLIAIWLTYLFCLLVFRSSLLGLLATLMMATIRGFLFQNLRGLRLEVYLIALLLFLLSLFLLKKPRRWWHPSLCAAAGGLCALNILSSLSYVYVLLAFFAIKNKWNWKLIPIFILLPILMVTPHLLNNKKEFGDYFYSTNIHARYYRNHEFKDQPGFPTTEELAKNGYAGSHITTFQYIFGLHTLGQVISRTWNGFLEVYFKSHVPRFLLEENKLVFYFFLVGLFLCIFGRWELLVCILVLNATTYFLSATPGIFFDWRLTAHVAPLVFIVSALGMERSITYLSHKLQEVVPTATPSAPAPPSRKKRKR